MKCCSITILYFATFLLLRNVNSQDDDTLHHYSPFEPKDGSVKLIEDKRHSFIVTASKIVRPNTLYRACVFLMPSSPQLTVKATVTKGNAHVSGASEIVESGSSANLIMKIPGSLSDGDYRLKVEGFNHRQTNKLVFKKEARLEFYPEFLSILVQTNRKVFKNEMTVRMRIILTQLVDLKPYADPVTVYVLDPNGFIMRRWPSRYPTTGVVVLNYQLPAFPRKGEWTIRVEALTQVHDYSIIVERFYYYFFDAIPSAPAYVHDTDDSYSAALTTSFHAGRVATGNVSVQVYARPVNSSIDDFKLVIRDAPPWNAEFAYDVPLRDVESALGVTSLAGWVIRVAMRLYDFFQGESRDAFIETRVIHNEVKMRFAGPKTAVFKPGMPFEEHLYVTYNDDEALTSEKLSSAALTVRCFVTTGNGQLKTLPDVVIPPKGQYVHTAHVVDDWYSFLERQAEDALFERFRTTGIHQFRFYIPEDAESIRITASYIDADGEQVNIEQLGVPYYSPGEFYVQVTTSTEEANFNHNAVIHLKSNFPFQDYHYLVTSKGLVVYGATQSAEHPTKSVTFSVSVSTEMAPSFKLVAMVTSPTGELAADSVTIPVRSVNRYKTNMTLVQNKDHSKQTVQVVTRTLPGCFVGVSLLRSTQFFFQADNAVTPSRFIRALYEMEPFTRSVYGVRWIDREGLQVDKVKYVTVLNPAPDSKRTFHFSGLIVLTDAKISHNPETATCNKENGYEPCLAVGCYHKSQRCDKKTDCADGSDEDDCPVDDDDRVNFRIFRRSRFHDFYDWLDGDWAWYDIPVTDDGFDFHDRPVPLTNEAWYLTAFTFHKDYGIAILDDVLEYDGSLPFYITVESPPSIRRGETVGVRLLFINNMDKPAMALLVLEASDDYAFVETGPEGEVEHYQPSVVEGERHHMIEVKAGEMFEVNFPISPRIERGTMTVNIRMMSQIFQQNLSIDIEVLPEGATITRHTSLLLDLKNRAHILRFLDISVEETPVIPYSKFRRYVFGSPRASMTVCGDVFGPVFLQSPISTSSYLSRTLRGTEANLFNLASTSWTLHYLRLTSQLTSDVLLSGLNDMNTQLADLMRLYEPSGAFRSQTNSKPSVWATAWAVRVLSQSQFQDWENHYFVDGRLLSNNVKWLLTFQSYDGSFDETIDYINPLDRREQSTNSTGRVARTAHILIALIKCIESLDGNLKVATAFGKNRGFQYLERVLPNLQDPFDIAIVTHALTLANSPAQETAFDKLHSLRRNDEGMVFWSRMPVPVNDIVYENQRPFLQPRLPSQQDAVAVEATAYALLVYLARDSIGDLHERVVTWLNTMRMVDGGFVSIYDTIVAMEALTEYAYQARLREITAMSIFVDASASPNSTVELHIDSENLAEVHHVEIPNVWGHVNVIGRGAGQAVVQLKVQYGIDWDELRDMPKRRFFDLYVEETYSHFRNKSHITVDACVKWLATDESPTSGAVTLEIEMPSGYWVVQSDAEKVLSVPDFNFLRDVITGSDKIVWMMDKVGPERLCFQYNVRRWFPVANMTMYRSAVVYETHSPEHFEMQVFNATPLYVLDICEVCGSYQCPYCPYFSSARAIFATFPVQLLIVVMHVIFQTL